MTFYRFSLESGWTLGSENLLYRLLHSYKKLFLLSQWQLGVRSWVRWVGWHLMNWYLIALFQLLQQHQHLIICTRILALSLETWNMRTLGRAHWECFTSGNNCWKHGTFLQSRPTINSSWPLPHLLAIFNPWSRECEAMGAERRRWMDREMAGGWRRGWYLGNTQDQWRQYLQASNWRLTWKVQIWGPGKSRETCIWILDVSGCCWCVWQSSIFRWWIGSDIHETNFGHVKTLAWAGVDELALAILTGLLCPHLCS